MKYGMMSCLVPMTSKIGALFTRVYIVRMYPEACVRPKKLKNTFLSICLAVLTIGISASWTFASETDPRQKLSEVNKDITNMQKMLKEIQDKHSSVELSLKKSEQEIKNLREEIVDLKDNIDQKELQKKRHQSERTRLEKEKITGLSFLDATLKSAYISEGADDPLKILLNQDTPASLTRLVTYYNYFSASQTETIKNIELTLEQLEETDKRLTDITQGLAYQHQQLNKKHEIMEKKTNEREQLAAKLKKEVSQRSRQLARLESERVGLNNIISSLDKKKSSFWGGGAESTPTTNSFKGQQGQISWPVQGKVIYHFNERRKNTDKLRWQGIYIQLREGSPVKAVYDGKVVFADWLKGFGLLVIIDHGHNYMTLYAHNKELLKKEGEKVSRGGVIAKTGKSSGFDKAGLYFEIRNSGRPSDPEKWLVPH